ncbi:outer membrane receptor protein [Aquitalea magnusonii]|uniref:Outer membrane receptor protein n=1 Tax=Aquitalea magnusonii TaxID=332411 RepID=A0A3G9GGM4_9NEIS|nr:major capsid protein P2 [Aquitalea magnusonii]BBF85401.1 outer membrane receptor protein [Aquitalea magnusonii]
MTKYVQKCNPFSNVTANGVATVSLQTGPTYKRIIMALGGTTFLKSNIVDIKVKIQGKTIIQASGSDLDTINKFKGIFDDPGFLTIDFSEIRARTINGEMLGALDTSRISSFTLEIKIAGATAPTLDAWAELDDPQAGSADRGVEFIVHKLLQYPVSAATSGLFNIDSLPKGDTGTLFKRIHIIGQGGANIVTDSTVKMNGLVIHETSDKLNRFRQQEYRRVPQAAMHTIDWVLDGNQSNMLDTRGNSVRNLQLLLNLSAAGQMYVYVEAIDAIGNL